MSDYLEEDREGRPENSVNLNDIVPVNNNRNNIYDTLQGSTSCTELLPSNVSGVTATTGVSKLAYIHACGSSQHRSRSHRSRHHRRHDSRSSQGSQTEEQLKTFFLKVKVGFLILCVINLLVIAVCLLTAFKVIPTEEREDFMTFDDDGEPKSFKLCTKCQPLVSKVGPITLVRNIRSRQFKDFCCFRRVDQLLELIDLYSHHYVEQISDTKEPCVKNSSVSRTTEQPAFAHVHWKKVSEHKGIHKLHWTRSGIDNHISGMRMMEGEDELEVTVSGYYYIYSHLKFKSGTDREYIHELILERKGFASPEAEKNMASKKPSSVIQGIYKLNKGNKVYVKATVDLLRDDLRRDIYLGLYRIK